MKLSSQQAENLKTYLANVLKYKETIDEVYDHVLSALDDKPENSRFQDAVNQILNDDFGGGKGLVKIERSNRKTTFWNLFHEVLLYIKGDFKFPKIVFTVPLVSACYYFTTHVEIIGNTTVVLALPLGVTLLFGISWIRMFFVGYYIGDKRKSLRDVNFVKIIYPVYWLLLIICISMPLKPKFYDIIIVRYPIIFAMFLTGYLLYIVAIIKICFEEFKPYLQKSS